MKRSVYDVSLHHPNHLLGGMNCQPVVTLESKQRRWWWQSKRPTLPNLRFAPLNSLAIPVPQGVGLMVSHLKSLKVFSGFNVLAPEVAFRHAKEVVDPIAVATIYRPMARCDEPDQMTHFFIHKWPD